MFRALARFFRAIKAVLTGRIDRAADGVSTHPDAIRAEYRDIIREKKERLQAAMDAVAQIMALRKKAETRSERLAKEIGQKQSLMEGAAAMAKKRVATLKGQGVAPEEISQDPEVAKCQGAYADFKSTLATIESELVSLEQQAVQYTEAINRHRTQLEGLQRGIAEIERESHEAVADVISGVERKRAADLLASISTDASSERLQRMRDIRASVSSKAEISEALAGTDTAAQEQEFLAYARESQADDEFSNLIGLGEETEEAPQEAPPEQETQLPEE